MFISFFVCVLEKGESVLVSPSVLPLITLYRVRVAMRVRQGGAMIQQLELHHTALDDTRYIVPHPLGQSNGGLVTRRCLGAATLPT